MGVKLVSMASNLKYNISKTICGLLNDVLKILPTGGKSLPGLVYIRLMGIENISILEKDQINTGSIIITGTNGKTTTTTMIIDLLSMDTNVAKSVDNNTIYALTTGLINNSGDLGVFEYGIRDIEHGQPKTIQKVVNPIGVVYTNISREHTQVAGVKNPFEEYFKAKRFLTENMKNGTVITNADDPFTAHIGKNKEKDLNVIYYGLNLNITHTIGQIANCPECGKPLHYNNHYMNHRGDYYCSCGFKKPELNVQINNLETRNNKWIIEIEANTYNQTKEIPIKFNTKIETPILGLHNLYNTLSAITTYSTFTPKPENIIENIKKYYSNLNEDILPQGRFEIIKYKNKLIGVGQGDNGDALLVNSLFMRQHIKNRKLHFLYTTPDAFEEEIFEDQFNVIKECKPDFVSVMPGRENVKIGRFYYNKVKSIFNSELFEIEELEDRIKEVINIINKSEYEYILITGCGDEHKFWAKLIDTIKNDL